MESLRRFKATAARTENEIGIGITEYTGKDVTHSIHSIYYPLRLSNRDTLVAILQHIQAELNDDEQALLRVKGARCKRSWYTDYQPKITTRNDAGRAKPGAYREPRALSYDALRRGDSICEHFGQEGLPSGEEKE